MVLKRSYYILVLEGLHLFVVVSHDAPKSPFVPASCVRLSKSVRYDSGCSGQTQVPSPRASDIHTCIVRYRGVVPGNVGAHANVESQVGMTRCAMRSEWTER